MIPIQLTIQGLYSYQKKQTIDFTQLTAAHLFGIFGSVGSGKSSILEAITFALYGETSRLNARDGRNYNMMNLKSNELFIEFEFETGKNQDAYRAVVQGKRNSKQFDDVKKLDRTAYKRVAKEWIPVELAEIEESIGLSYENFKRTIIVPQGQFQEFLQLGNTERTKMMKELFNLEKFELYYKTVALESKNNEQKQNIQGQLQQLGEIDPNRIVEMETQLLELKKILDYLEEKIKTGHKEEAKFQQILELTKKLETTKTAIDNLHKQEPEFIQLEKTTQQYEKCVLQFKNLLDRLETSAKKVVEKTNQIKIDSDKLAKEEAEIAKNENTLKSIKFEYDNRENLKQRAGELEKLAKIRDLDILVENEKQRLGKGNEILQQTSKTVESLTSGKQKLNEHIKSQKELLPDLALLSTIKTWYVQKQSIDKQISEAKSDQSKLQVETEKLSFTVNGILKTPLFDELTDKTEFNNIMAYSQSQIDSMKTAIKKLESEADHFRVKAQLEKYATNLTEGDPCPLCGSTHHPEIYRSADILHEQSKIEKQKSDIEKQIEKWNETILELKDLNSQLAFKKEVLNNLKTKSLEIQNRATHHQSLFLWPEYTDMQKVDDAFNAAEILQKEIKQKEKDLEKMATDLENAIKNKEKYQNAIEEIRTQITIKQTENKTLLEQLNRISPEEYLNKTNTEIEAERNSLIQQFSNLEKQFNDITVKLTELRKSKDTLSGILSANHEVLKSEQENLENLQNEFQTRLTKTEYKHVDEIKNILSQNIDIESNNIKINNFRQNLALAKSRFSELQTEMSGRTYDIEAHKKLIAEVNENKILQNTKNQEKGKTEAGLKKLKKDMEDQAVLRKQMEKLELRGENIKTMKSLFKASGFVNYISSVYLQNLCFAANERFFKLTRQKLSLEITEDNNFQVRDFMNGGKVRNVKTLSGGQTFQAALSLALALADNIQKITESNQNFFFLDEGFGSLDRESLATVFDTLKSLRHENRIVGVISHVEEMQQEIDVHLRIENNDDMGSLIFESWAG